MANDDINNKLTSLQKENTILMVEVENLKEILSATEAIACEQSNNLRISLEEHKDVNMFIESLLTSISSLLIGVDINLNVSWWNKAAEKLFGIPAADVIGKPFVDSGIKWNWDEIDEQIPTWLSTYCLIFLPEIQYLRPDKTEGLLGITVSPTIKKDEERLGFLLVGTDITKRIQNEQRLRESEKKLSIIGSCVVDALIMVDGSGNVAYWNSAAEKMFGYPSDDVMGKSLHHIIVPPKYLEMALRGFEVFKNTGDGPVIGSLRELSGMHKDGSEFPVELAISSMIVRGEWWAIGTIRNVTERKNMEIQLRHAQKLEAVGQLAAGIAHEINTPTQYVGDNTRFLKNCFSDIEKLLQKYDQMLTAAKQGTLNPELIAEIEEAIEEADLEYLADEIPNAIQQSLEGVKRVAEIVGAMKEFSHPGREDKVPIDISKAIKSTITVSRNEWKYVADIVTDFDSMLPLVPCIPGDFNQVILNLIVNAAHAVGDVLGSDSTCKGKITISTRHNGSWAEIRVEDTGTGIPETARNRIFDPFFTTKEVGKGTGQGMSICHSIVVKKHGGTIEFETEIGKGTIFTVLLPIEI